MAAEEAATASYANCKSEGSQVITNFY